jgi:hypothetical protein
MAISAKNEKGDFSEIDSCKEVSAIRQQSEQEVE